MHGGEKPDRREANSSLTTQSGLSLTRLDGRPTPGGSPPEGCPAMESMGKEARPAPFVYPELKAEIVELCQRGESSGCQMITAGFEDLVTASSTPTAGV